MVLGHMGYGPAMVIIEVIIVIMVISTSMVSYQLSIKFYELMKLQAMGETLVRN